MFALAIIAVAGIYQTGSFGRRLGSSGGDSKKDLIFLVDGGDYDREGLIGQGASAYPSGPPSHDLATPDGKRQWATDMKKFYNKDATFQDQVRKSVTKSWGKLLETTDKDARPKGLPQFTDLQPHKQEWMAYYQAIRDDNKNAGGNTYPGSGRGKDKTYKLYGPIKAGDGWKQDLIKQFCTGKNVDKDKVDTQESCNLIPWVLGPNKRVKMIEDNMGKDISGIYLQIENIGFFVRIAIAVNPEQLAAIEKLAAGPAALPAP